MQQRGNHLKNMNTITKYILGFVALVAAIFFSWYFFSVIIYILVAAVISFIGKPIIDLLSRVKFRGHYLPGTAKAAITVNLPVVAVHSVFRYNHPFSSTGISVPGKCQRIEYRQSVAKSHRQHRPFSETLWSIGRKRRCKCLHHPATQRFV